MTQEQERPTCPECGAPEMMKFGLAWSGRRKLQRWKCDRCGKVLMPTHEDQVGFVEAANWNAEGRIE